MKSSLIKSIKISNFRAIKEIEFIPGRRLTLLTGKNGTAKSTILGMIAQPFSFNSQTVLGYSLTQANQKEAETKKEMLQKIQKIKTIYNKNFESKVDQHFKLSEIDARGEEHALINFYNKTSRLSIDLKIESNNYSDRLNPRLVTRKPNLPAPKKGEKDQRSSNETFPVVYLGLSRVFPIVLTDGFDMDLNLTESEQKYIKRLYDQILLHHYDGDLQGTNDKDKNTLSFIPSNRSINMISAGEDNVGQILGALLSFKRLKQSYQEYTGGILLIDEVDATLYPGAQKQLLEVLLSQANDLDLQVFVTSHSTYLIDIVSAKIESAKSDLPPYPGDLKIISLKKENDSTINVLDNESRLTIWQDLHEEIRAKEKEEKIRLYFEDKEASFFYKYLTPAYIKKRTEIIDVSLGCEQYLTLNKANIPEFCHYACILLDGDVDKLKIKSTRNIVLLPSINKSPPEKLIYEYLHSENCSFWKKCDSFYKKTILTSNSHNVVIKEILDGEFRNASCKSSGSPYYKKHERDVWKMWFKEEQSHWTLKKNNPIVYWAKENPDLVDSYIDNLKKSLTYVATNLGLRPF
ncbi:AAA family ATPase [Paenibacillus sp. WLX2291]|uniref:AAA family ATPase n=1 Tax=Paenibacillus sp. WLX2291 TaxID=3296934 RepID=UPI0039843173